MRANSGEEALQKLEEEEFAVILMDVRMPGMDGLRTAELIMSARELGANSDYLSDRCPDWTTPTWSAVMSAAPSIFCSKPFDPEILRSKVSVFVDLYQKEQMIKRQAALLRQRDREAFERRSELRFRSLMDALPQCVWVARADLTFYYWNKRAVDYIGVNRRWLSPPNAFSNSCIPTTCHAQIQNGNFRPRNLHTTEIPDSSAAACATVSTDGS